MSPTTSKIVRLLALLTVAAALGASVAGGSSPAPLEVPELQLGDAVSQTDRDPQERAPDAGGILPDPPVLPPVAGCRHGGLVVSGATLRRVKHATLCVINAERTRRGLRRLKLDRRLRKAATRHSQDMVKRRYFSHDSPSGRKLVHRVRAVRYLRRSRSWVVGENLAWGNGAITSPEAIVQAWLASPPHRANLLSARYSSVGVGVASGTPLRRGSGATYTANFGRVRKSR